MLNDLRCEACGSHPEVLRHIRLTNGGLRLCQQCLDEFNAKNPEVKQLRDRLAKVVEAAPAFLATTWVPLLGVDGWSYADWKELHDSVADVLKEVAS